MAAGHVFAVVGAAKRESWSSTDNASVELHRREWSFLSPFRRFSIRGLDVPILAAGDGTARNRLITQVVSSGTASSETFAALGTERLIDNANSARWRMSFAAAFLFQFALP